MGIIALLIQVLYILILARVLISWVPDLRRSQFGRIIYDLTEPILAPIRQILPPMGGLDLSPIVLFLILSFVSRALF